MMNFYRNNPALLAADAGVSVDDARRFLRGGERKQAAASLSPQERAFCDNTANLIQAEQLAAEHESTRYKYRFIACEHNRPAQFLAALAAKALGLTPFPIVRIFIPAHGNDMHFGKKQDIHGLFIPDESMSIRETTHPVIRIKRRSITDMISTIGHECRHVWQYRKGKWHHDPEWREDDADEFGHKFAAALGLPSWTKEFDMGKGWPGTMEFKGMGSASGCFYLDTTTDTLYQAHGYKPRPSWDVHRRINLEAIL